MKGGKCEKNNKNENDEKNNNKNNIISKETITILLAEVLLARGKNDKACNNRWMTEFMETFKNISWTRKEMEVFINKFSNE